MVDVKFEITDALPFYEYKLRTDVADVTLRINNNDPEKRCIALHVFLVFLY